MGSTSSKFRKALYVGDEKTAEEVYHGSMEFQKVFDPNTSYGENYNHNTPLHYASRHGMHRLVRIFIQRHNGNPNKRNSDNQTSLHCVCMEEQIRPPSSTYSYSQYYYSQPPEKKRQECVRLVLAWRGIVMGDGEREQIQIDAEDEDGNTALHYAAGSGYLSLVEMLLEHNASMFIENADKETPCDCAERHQHVDIAQLLESKMVFSSPINDDEVADEVGSMQYEEGYSGLRVQELQEAKDLVVVETADMLRVPLFTAEALLRNFEWSRESLLESWIQNPEECCEKCGVKPPENLDSFIEEHKLTSLEPKPATPQEEPIMCDICTSTVPAEEISSDTLCSHQFCRECWERYLSGKIKEGHAHSIICPGYDCDRLVPVETIEKLVSREMARRYLQFDINAFVESNPKLKWCPVAGCGRAVQMPLQDPSKSFGSSNGHRPSNASTPSTPPSISHAVDCGQGHIFCWDCSGDAHEPCSCENWKKWMDKISEIKPEELASTDNETELAANCLWLVTNSKPCPKCMAPIQKNDGCNHMKCTKCKHDFCWVCQEPWSKHSSETGGYFRCNRFEVVTKVDEKSESLLTDAEKKHRDMQELNRFIHFYTRFKNHGLSHSLEEPLLRRAPAKMRKLGSRSGPSALEETKFIKESITELLRARRILRFSYPYGYHLEDRGGSKQIFEFMQNELEEATETLSQMVARHYLRTPRHKIIQAAQLVLRKRHEFLSAVGKGLVPPDTPPRLPRRPSSHRQSSWDSDSDEEDEAFRQAIEASLQEAVAQAESSTDQQDDSPLAFLDLHLKPNRKRHGPGTRDPGSMTEGLLRALEMSQLLLMQQTEQLQPHDPNNSSSTTAASSSSSSYSAVGAPSNSETSTGQILRSSSAPVTSVKPFKLSTSQAQTSQMDEGESLSSFDEDFRKAIQLSLQEIEGTIGTGPSEDDTSSTLKSSRDSDYRAKTEAQSSSRSRGSAVSSKSRKKKQSSKDHKSSKDYSRPGKSGSSSKKGLGGELSIGGLLDLSQELESEFERIKRKTLTPEEDVQKLQEDETASKSPWAKKPEERKGSLPKHLAKASSNLKEYSSRSFLLSTTSGKALNEESGPLKSNTASAISLESGDGVRAARASSDPYASAIKSLLTHLESKRAVSAEHVSKAKPQLSETKNGSHGSADSSGLTQSEPSRSPGISLAAASSYNPAAKPSKPTWLEGPLLAKTRHKKTTEKSKDHSGVSSASTGKPSSLNIELYMSRKATPEEEQKRGSEKVLLCSDSIPVSKPSKPTSTDLPESQNSSGFYHKNKPEIDVTLCPDSPGALNQKGATADTNTAESQSKDASEPKASTEELSLSEQTLSKVSQSDGTSVDTGEIDPKLGDAHAVLNNIVESFDCPVEKNRDCGLEQKGSESISSSGQGELKQEMSGRAEELLWVAQSSTSLAPGMPLSAPKLETENAQSIVGVNKPTLDKLSVEAKVDEPVWKQQKEAGLEEQTNESVKHKSQEPVDSSGDAKYSPSSSNSNTVPESLELPASTSTQNDLKPENTQVPDVPSPIWEHKEHGNTDGDKEESDSQVWQMFI